MKDQPSTSDDQTEPERPGTIPDDFIWDPEIEAWYAPGIPSVYPGMGPLPDFDDPNEQTGRRGLYSVEYLRAAGALDFPPEWRKSLSAGTLAAKKSAKSTPQRDLFSDLDDGDDAPAKKSAPTLGVPDADEDAEETAE